jgi:catalase
MAKRRTLATTTGMPVADNQNSLTARPLGPAVGAE